MNKPFQEQVEFSLESRQYFVCFRQYRRFPSRLSFFLMVMHVDFSQRNHVSPKYSTTDHKALSVNVLRYLYPCIKNWILDQLRLIVPVNSQRQEPSHSSKVEGKQAQKNSVQSEMDGEIPLQWGANDGHDSSTGHQRL